MEMKKKKKIKYSFIIKSAVREYVISEKKKILRKSILHARTGFLPFTITITIINYNKNFIHASNEPS